MATESTSCTRMPAVFRSLSMTSLGQRRSGSRSVARAMVSAVARPSASVSTGRESGGSGRRSTTETYRPAPGSECQEWPWRPWPGGCSLAATTGPGWAARGGQRGGLVHGGGDGFEEKDLAAGELAADEIDVERGAPNRGWGLGVHC